MSAARSARTWSIRTRTSRSAHPGRQQPRLGHRRGVLRRSDRLSAHLHGKGPGGQSAVRSPAGHRGERGQCAGRRDALHQSAHRHHHLGRQQCRQAVCGFEQYDHPRVCVCGRHRRLRRAAEPDAGGRLPERGRLRPSGGRRIPGQQAENRRQSRGLSADAGL